MRNKHQKKARTGRSGASRHNYLYAEKPILGGLFFERRRQGWIKLPGVPEPCQAWGHAGYRINREKFKQFLVDYEKYVAISLKLRTKMGSQRSVDSESKRTTEQARRVYEKGQRNFGWMEGTLYTAVRQEDNQLFPFFNPIYFPRKARSPEFWKLVDIVFRFWGIHKGESKGSLSGSRFINSEKAKLIDSLKAKGRTDIQIAEKIFPKDYELSDIGDPIPKHRARFKRFRKFKQRPLPQF